LRLKLELVAFADGFLGLNARLTNEAADSQTGVYAAVVARWEQPRVRARALCADNRVAPLAARDWSLFRRGEGRHLFTQRGVDWVEMTFDGRGAAAWLNDFAPSFTMLDSTSRNTFNQPRYFGANVPQLGQEVQTMDDRLFSITEIARSNIRSYRDRLAENILPARGEGVAFSSRVVFNAAAFAPSQVDRMPGFFVIVNVGRLVRNDVRAASG
jgi:hypothetical protein